MFGLEFLFTAALWALPLAALPLILHLLYRRKSPVVPFPTLRFIKASLQQNAARRKVQRWLLLAIRMLLLALLIWAVAQPAKVLASRFFSAGVRSTAVVVVDTSWSMQYRQDQITLLASADQMVQQLLRDELKDASVVLLTTGTQEPAKVAFHSPSELLSQWTPLKPEASREPLSDRVSQGLEILQKQPSDQKLLLVISDFQAKEFPRALPDLVDPQVRLVAMDLHPERPRSAGIRSIALKPQQPIRGIHAAAEVEVAGPPGDVRPVTLTVRSLKGQELLARPPQMARFDDSGRAVARFDLDVPAERWQLVTAKLQGEDPTAWDDERSLALELPDQQQVTVADGRDSLAAARRVVRLALDPNEGKLASWPVRVGTSQNAGQNVMVALLETPPDQSTLSRWQAQARSGGTVVLMLRPGFEVASAKAPAGVQRQLEAMLPSRPYVEGNLPEVMHTVPTGATREDPVTAALSADVKTLELLRLSRIVPMTVADPKTTKMLMATAGPDGRAAPDRNGLLYVKKVGRGRVFTWACVPEGTNTNLGTHPFFLPLLVNQCLRPTETSGASNVQLPEAVICDDPQFRDQAELELRSPDDIVVRVKGTERDGRQIFASGQAQAPGVYRWSRVGETTLAGVADVMPPGDEAEATYRAAESVVPQSDRVLVARSLEGLQQRVAQVGQPQPKWSLPLAIVLILLCTEGLLSSETGIWTWFRRGQGREGAAG